MIEIKIVRDLPEAEAQEAKELFNGVVPQSVFDDVAELQEEVAILKSKMIDSGWIDLPLTNGAISYSAAQKPQYRKVGS